MGNAEHPLNDEDNQIMGLSECSIVKQIFKTHSFRMAQHELMVTILHLSRFIQRHRGATLALLGGDKSFHNQAQILQKQTSLQFEYLDCLNQSANQPLGDNEYKQLTLGWVTVLKDWENDDIHHSFEFHSHLLELILRITRQLIESILRPPSLTESNEALESRVDNAFLTPLTNLSQTCVIELFELIEYLARIRGLGTHMAAVGTTNPDWENRVGFWLQEFRYRKDRFDHNIQLLPNIYLPFIPALKALPNSNLKLNYFINLLGHEMTADRTIKVPSHKLFLMGTEIIDGYLAIMDQANAVIREQLTQMNHMFLERLA